jgi:hypothetical protein
LGPEVLKKMESYESGRSVLLEKMEELAQALDRLTTENRSTREWFKTRLQLLWESCTRQDQAIAESMNGILKQSEEMCLHIGLRNAGEKLEALLKVPADASTSSTLPFTVPTSSTTAEADFAMPDPPNKRPAPADEVPLVDNKRRKVGES